MLRMIRATALLTLFLCSLALHGAEPIACTGVWSPQMSEKKLAAQFGAANVKRANIYVAEGNETPGTVVFPNDEKRRVEIVWRDGKRQKVEWLRIPSGSQWTTFAGIGIGTTLEEVEKRNGRAFKLYGFDWDYGGGVTDWRGGKLASTGTPCRMQITFDVTVPDNPSKALERALTAVSGDREILSSNANMRLVRPRVSAIVISFPE
jgi:hypothetical protein